MKSNPKIRAAVITVFFLAISFCLILWFTEAPINIRPRISRGDCAALAIRDNVSSFEKFGTRLFTWSNLRNSYSEVVYVTEYSRNEKHREFVAGLNALLSKYRVVDLFLLAHANEYYKWVMEIDSVKRKNIRLVYNTGCSGTSQKDIWLNLGARTYVGHESSESISPVFYFFFLRRWCAGEKLADAVKGSNELMRSRLHRLNIHVDPLVLSGSEAKVFGKGDYGISNE